MDEFLEELKSGEIQFRDRWQFELKSDYSPRSSEKTCQYTQEFYFFIPNSLQITQDTYSKEDFYKDLTNLIRYKTPVTAMNRLIDSQYEESPLYRLDQLAKLPASAKTTLEIQNEIKLLGNVFRSSLRAEIQKILELAYPPQKAVETLCEQIIQFRKVLRTTIDPLKAAGELQEPIEYLDEFVGNSVDYYLTGLLDQFQMHHSPVSKEMEDRISDLIIQEAEYRKQTHHASIEFSESLERDEHILYRIGLLKKYFVDSLLLRVDRESIQEQYGTLISGFSTASATLVYLLLFIWQGQWFVINSLPFVVITVAAYVLKDRLKEVLKSLSYQRALGYFSDYTTKILSPEEEVIGELKESFAFVDEEHIPEEIRTIRNFEFHAMLKSFKRPEQVIYFKRLIKIYPSLGNQNPHFSSLNISLRLNLQKYLGKASDPFHSYLSLDKISKKVLKLRLPKVYHINVILKNQFYDDSGLPVKELQKFRIIIDKNGIKNIEQIRT